MWKKLEKLGHKARKTLSGQPAFVQGALELESGDSKSKPWFCHFFCGVSNPGQVRVPFLNCWSGQSYSKPTGLVWEENETRYIQAFGLAPDMSTWLNEDEFNQIWWCDPQHLPAQVASPVMLQRHRSISEETSRPFSKTRDYLDVLPPQGWGEPGISVTAMA